MSEIQSVAFERSLWSIERALRWLQEHDIKPTKRVDTTQNWYRFRITNPDQYLRFRTEKPTPGIMFTFGFK